jgi:hypothetical protein
MFITRGESFSTNALPMDIEMTGEKNGATNQTDSLIINTYPLTMEKKQLEF